MSGEIIDLLKAVLMSWEVIAVSAALVLYLFLVFYVARLNRRPRPARAAKGADAKKKAAAAPVAETPAQDEEE